MSTMDVESNMSGDIVDRIDALVDEQMAGGEPATGYDFRDPQYPRCPHCSRHWHGLPITESIASMYSFGQFDEEYRSAEDDSRVLCRGSDFIGPMPAENRSVEEWAARLTTATDDGWYGPLVYSTIRYACEQLVAVTGIPYQGNLGPEWVGMGFIDETGVA